MVVSPPDPGITLSGKGELTLQLNDVKGHDFRPFDDLSISLQAKQSGGIVLVFRVYLKFYTKIASLTASFCLLLLR